MSNALVHVAAGAVGGLLPDVALAAYGWRRRYLEPGHPLVCLHRALHGPGGVILACAAGAAIHVLLDRHARHRLPSWVECDLTRADNPLRELDLAYRPGLAPLRPYRRDPWA